MGSACCDDLAVRLEEERFGYVKGAQVGGHNAARPKRCVKRAVAVVAGQNEVSPRGQACRDDNLAVGLNDETAGLRVDRTAEVSGDKAARAEPGIEQASGDEGQLDNSKIRLRAQVWAKTCERDVIPRSDHACAVVAEMPVHRPVVFFKCAAGVVRFARAPGGEGKRLAAGPHEHAFRGLIREADP